MIIINNLIKSVGTRKLFEMEHLTIDEKDKIGLIGENGVGKTTFFRILLGFDEDYSGKIEVNSEIGYLLNETEVNKNFKPEIYSKAGLDSGDNYSPGEEQRLKLLNLLSEPAFLLIDEPTSHLDIEQKDKLIENLQKRREGYLIISHDRDFINQSCNKIFDMSNGKFEVFNGDYDFYLDEKVKRSKSKQREYESYIQEKNRLEGLAAEIKKKSSKVRKTPKRMGNSEARLHKMGNQGNKKKLDQQASAVQSRIDRLEVKERPKEEGTIELSLSEKEKIHSKVLIQGVKLNKRFGEKILFENADFTIENNHKIALLGENGSGKTTLLKMILDKEEIQVHPNLKIGYYSQMGEILESSKSILDNILETSVYDQSMTRIILARLSFRREDVYKRVSILSDGERAKIKLAKLLTSNFNYLIFDEPTNFLDIRAIEALEELLASYDRPFIFVTHDISFINHIADSLLIIKDYKISYFNGNYKQYNEKDEDLNNMENMDNYLIDFRLSTINSRLAMEISKDEREELELEYERLLLLKKK